MIRKIKYPLLLLLTVFSLGLNGCEDDPIIDPTGDTSGDGGSYGGMDMPQKKKNTKGK